MLLQDKVWSRRGSPNGDRSLATNRGRVDVGELVRTSKGLFGFRASSGTQR
ncbi:hypothetical protein ABZ671_28505 [Micromonospora sp. NPDC006766]|uniref:hypothetical protein n=1 Tax=Micromonospora sp. NPDC006766 TaxID=3154778 RepID=UPI0033E52418